MRTTHLRGTERHSQVPTGTSGRASRGHRYRAAIVGLPPCLLLIGLVYHPHIDDLRDKGTVAAALTADTTRWGIAHVMVGLAAALVLLGFLSVDAFLRESGHSGVSARGVPFIVIGSVLFAFLPAMEIAMLGVYGAGFDVEEVLLEMNTWFQPILLAGAAAFAVGVAFFAVAIARSRVLGRGLTWLVVGALGVATVARFVPLGAALYLGAAALAVALLPIAAVMAKHPTREVLGASA
ncbi:MAG: hypothetical protein M3400_17105 [Actinomycetota bacterium]|nr:hypothetical protein [Actinomycetota bacterium]